MGQLFRPSANLLSRVVIFGGLLLLLESILILGVYFRSNLFRQVHVAIQQPVAFSHVTHNDVLGIDCRYCHTAVTKSAFASVPPTETCMTCHSQVAVDRTSTQPIRTSWQTGQPITWIKVYDLPDFVYFNHSAHVNKGVGCTTCHGQVNQMSVIWQQQALYMGWCLNCHRNPEKYLRPREEVYNMDYVAPQGTDQIRLGVDLVQKYDVHKSQLTNCAICHR